MSFVDIAAGAIGQFIDYVLATEEQSDVVLRDLAYRRHRSATDRLTEFMGELSALGHEVGPVVDAIDRGNFASGFATLELALGSLVRRGSDDPGRAARISHGRDQTDRALDSLYAAVLHQGPAAGPKVRAQVARLARIGSILAEVFEGELRAADLRSAETDRPIVTPALFAPDSPSGFRLHACLEALRIARGELFGRMSANAGPAVSKEPTTALGRVPERRNETFDLRND